MKKTAAFSLIEVLIFVTVFALFFVLAASVVTTTLRITKENQNKIRATHFAEELKDWLQTEKEVNWGGSLFVSSVNSFTEQTTISQPQPGANTSFCFNQSPISAWPNVGASNCLLTLGDNQFRRIATFSATAADIVNDSYVKRINADVTVEWKEGDVMRSVPIKIVFSVWE